MYDAEQQLRRMLERSADFPIVEVAGSRITLPSERRFANIESVQTYVDKVLALNWVRRGWPAALTSVKVRERQGQAKAHYERNNQVIAVPAWKGNRAWALRELVVLHELAHHLDSTGGAAHGAGFLHAFGELMSELIGPEVAFIFRTML